MEEIVSKLRVSDMVRLNSLTDKDVRFDIITALEEIPFVYNLCKADRKRIHECPKDSKGRIIVNITEPHVLENMDYFRQPAITFKKNGRYTDLIKNNHPRSLYMVHWKEEQRRCREGLIREDGEWITGYYYWYLNYCPIMLVNTVTKDFLATTEDLYEVHTSFESATSFSDTVTADRIEDFPKVWDSDYLWFHYVDQAENKGQHCTNIKTRGRGYSFKGGSMLGRNYYHFKQSKSFAIASEGDYLIGDAILDKTWDVLSFVDSYTPWVKSRDFKNTTDHKKASYIDPKTKVEKGIKTEIIGVTTKNQPEKARGKRGKLLLFEEAGKFPHLIKAHTIARPSVEQGRYVFGTIVSWGTGGTAGADFDGLRELFTNPAAHNIYGLPNVFDRKIFGMKNCGFYCGEYMNREGLTDENGNSDVIGALIEIFIGRRELIRSTNDPNVLVQERAERSITPDEAMMRKEGHLFNVEDLKHQLAEIETHPKKYADASWKVNLYSKEGSIYYRNSTQPVVRQYPIKENKGLTGCIEIFEHPIIDSPRRGLYIAGCLTPGEKVCTDKGLKNVEDITLDDKLINKDGLVVPINTLLRYDKIDEEVFNVTMTNVDKSTKFTSEHPIYVSDTVDGDYSFVTCENIKEGQWTKYPNIYNQEKIIESDFWTKHRKKGASFINNPLYKKDFWWFVGMWLGDGFCSNTGRNFTTYMCFGEHDKVIINKYKRIINELFNRKPCLKSPKNSNALKFESSQLYSFLEDNFGKYADGKFISEWVKYLPNELKLQLILGYLDSDGSVYNDKGSIRASFTSINKKLLGDVQDILFSLGIVSSINIHSKECAYNINGKTGISKQSYHVNVNQTNVKKLADLYNSDYTSRKLIFAKTIIPKQRTKINPTCILSDDLKYIHIKIKSIEKSTYTGIVYNFDCQTHTFIVPYCTTHNCDPYDDDTSQGPSLGCTFIMNRLTKRIVAEYTGRPNTAEEFYENTLRLLKYYNAVCNYENNKKGLFGYFDKMKSLYYLADTPKILRDMQVTKSVGRGNTLKGTTATAQVNKYGNSLLRSYLVEPAYGNDDERNWQQIPSEGMVKELIAFNPNDGNYDRVAALRMLMILLAEYDRYELDDDIENVEVKSNMDPFFLRTRQGFGSRFVSSGDDNYESKKLMRR